MTKRIFESGTIVRDTASKSFRVCLITEGIGSSAEFPREFFIAENAKELAGALSFPNHPLNLERPDHRDPLSAIGHIGENVTIEEHEGKLGFWGEFIPSKSKPQIAEYLNEYAAKLALSVYADSDGHEDAATGRWIAESITPNDPYRSVDLVIAAGRGGKFDTRLAESYRRVVEASASAEENEEDTMELKDVQKVVDDAIAPLTKLVESLAAAKTEDAVKAAQVTADETAAAQLAEARIENYDKAVGLISEAKLTESFDSKLRGLAKGGAKIEDITTEIEEAKKIISEARAGLEENDTIIHLGGGATKVAESYSVPGFGEVR